MNNFIEISNINNEAGGRRGQSGRGDLGFLAILHMMPESMERPSRPRW